MAINWDEIDKKAKKIDQQNDAKRRAQASAAQQRAMIAPKPSKATTTNAPYVGASASGTGFGFDPLAKKDKSKKPNLVGIDPYLIDNRRGERIGRTLLGATESYLGTSINALDVTSKTPIQNPSLYLLRRYNDIFMPDALGKGTDYLMGKSEKNISKAKEGLGGAGKVAVDVGVGATQLAGDIGLAAATGGSSLIPMAVRSFGGSAYEAEKSGASLGQQIAYGGLSAATSLLVEKISNAGKILGKAYGKGATDDVLEKGLNKAIGKLIKNDAVSSRISTALAAGAGEGVEEMIESTLSPIYQKITYNPDAKYDADTVADILYDGLIGAIIGGLAGGLGGANADAKQQVDNTQAKPDTNAVQFVDTIANNSKPQAKVDSLSDFKTTANQNTTSQQGISSPIEVVNNILSKPVTNAEAERVINTPALKTAFETLTGQQIQGTKSEQRAQVKQSQQVVQAPTINPNIQPIQDTQINQTNATAQQALPQGTGAMSPEFAYQEKTNQQHSTDTAFTESERQMQGLRHEDSTHQVVTDKAAIAQAEQRLAFDFEGEKADLATKQDWDKADTTTAHLILRKLTEDARNSGDYSEVVKWSKTLEKQKSAQGQALQANRQFANTPESIIADAAESLFSDKTKNISETKKTELINKIYNYAETLDNIQQGDTVSAIELIKSLSAQRKTNGIFNKEMSGTMSSALDYIGQQDWGFDFLKEIAAGQVRSVATDYNKVGFWTGVKAIRFSNMLSSIATVMRNLGGNQTFDIGDSISNNVAIPFDMLLSKLSGNRTVAFDKSWASKAKRQGSIDGFLKSFVQVGLDVDIDNVRSKYETTPGRTFKMTGNPMERFLSTVQKWQGYALQSTDEFAKGGTAAEAQRGIDKLKRRGKADQNILQDRATEIAKQRTFQDDSAAAKAIIGLRSSMNHFRLTDSQGGTFGVGDLMVPFAQVPSNLATQAVNATPAGLAKSTVQFANALAKAAQGKLTPEAQANVATNLGRGLVGSAGFAMFAGLAMKGILKVTGSDDKDKDALERSEGMSGTQLNVDALSRWVKGKSAEWKSGDKLVNMGFLEHLNVQMAGGALIAEAYKDDAELSAKDIAKASVQSVFQTVLELPAISQIQELIDGYRYSKEDDISGKLVDAGGSYLGSQASSFIVPNIVAGVARGLDPKVRDVHSSDSIIGQTKDDIISKIPKLREGLPVKLDPWGDERTSIDNGLLHFANSTLFPAKVNQYRTNELNKEIFRLNKADADIKFPSRKLIKKIEYDGEDYELNITEQNQYFEKSHKLAYEYMTNAIKDSQYKKMTDAEKAKFLSDMQNYALDVAKRDFFTQKGVEYSSDYNKVAKAQELGINPTAYFQYKYALKRERPEGGTPTQLQFSSAINTLKLSNEDKGKLWDIENQKYSEKNPFTGTLAQYGLPPEYTIEIMRAFKQIEQDLDDYEKPEKGPSKAHVQAAYFRQWLISRGFNWGEVAAIEDVFITWQSIPVTKPSKKAQYYVATNPK